MFTSKGCKKELIEYMKDRSGQYSMTMNHHFMIFFPSSMRTQSTSAT